MWIRSHEQSVAAWTTIAGAELSTAMSEGKAMATYHHRLVINAAAQAVDVDFGPDAMPLATCSYDLGSDVCDHLIRERGIDVAAYMLFNRQGEYQYGFRSVPGFDCSKIAVRYGGGGHAQAAGCTSRYPLHQ